MHMSLNWKEIDLILEELALPGAQIQKAIQSSFDILSLKLYGRNGAKTLLVSLSPGACRVHETFDSVPKNIKPLRFAEFLNSRIVNGRIEEACQLGNDRIIRLTIYMGSHSPDEDARSRNPNRYRMYIRLWSNAANVIVTDMEGAVLDAMRRLPKKGEISGGSYTPEKSLDKNNPDKIPGGLICPEKPGKEYCIRNFPEELLSKLPGNPSFNQKIDAFYRQEGGSLSLEALQEEARRKYEGSIDRITASLEKLREKEKDFSSAEKYREYGDIILANLGQIKYGDQWLEAENFFQEKGSIDDPLSTCTVRIKLDTAASPASQAEIYYEQYRKAKSGLKEIQGQILECEEEIRHLKEVLKTMLLQTNPLALHKQLSGSGRIEGEGKTASFRKEDNKRPGLSFRRKDWLIIVGRDAAENDALLRRHVKGNDLWLHARDFPGSYVFIKQRAGKSFPLDILLDAGNLAIFYSKGRNNGEGNLFYTQVKYLRRAKNGPKGLVIPTQEKNLHVKVEADRLKELEKCKL